MSKLRGIDGGAPPIPPGGVLLGEQLPQFTEHVTTFKNCQVGVEAVVDENQEVIRYHFFIKDPKELHLYVIGLTQELKDQLRTAFFQLPDIGEKVPQGRMGA